MTRPFRLRPRAARAWPLALAAALLAVPAAAAAVAPGGAPARGPVAAHPAQRAAAATVASTAASTVADPCPPPGNIGTIVSAEYNGVPPSVQDDRLVGPTLLVKSATVDPACDGPVTLPLYEGRMRDGTPVWYVLTETDDEANARAIGINFSSKITYADSPSTSDARGNDKDRDAVRNAVQAADGTLVFDCGAVDFSPVRRVEGTAFPPTVAQPGSRGDSCYTPLVKVRNAGGHIYNAPVVAYGTSAEELSTYCTGAPDYSKVHDKVLHICPEAEGGGTTGGTVTLKRTVGFSFARPVVYLSFESNDPVGATLEAATLTPRLSRLGRGRDDSAFSAVERLFAFTNGPTGRDNPQRQGLTSAVRGEGDPLNTFGGIPTLALDYSPLWDLQVGEWTKTAVDRGYRSRETEEFAILSLVRQGYITGPGGSAYGSSGVIVNCPVIARLL